MENKIEIRTCKTCGHRDGDKCMLSGYYCTTERHLPTKCGLNFDNWTPRPKRIGFKKWLLSLWYGD
jgi:hypothetical protein